MFNRIKRLLKQRKKGFLLAFEITRFFIDVIVVVDIVAPYVVRLFQSSA